MMGQALSKRLMQALLGKPLVSNAFRGTLVEAILATVLEPEWVWQTEGWSSYDFQGPGKIGLEVKQSAARQNWHDATSKPNLGRFDIAARTGRYEDNVWIPEPGRAAAIYVFAWHPLCDSDLTDHRVAEQWEFYAIRASELPAQDSLALSGIRARALPRSIGEIKGAVSDLIG